jgi:hypothetical protein
MLFSVAIFLPPYSIATTPSGPNRAFPAVEATNAARGRSVRATVLALRRDPSSTADVLVETHPPRAATINR